MSTGTERTARAARRAKLRRKRMFARALIATLIALVLIPLVGLERREGIVPSVDLLADYDALARLGGMCLEGDLGSGAVCDFVAARIASEGRAAPGADPEREAVVVAHAGGSHGLGFRRRAPAAVAAAMATSGTDFALGLENGNPGALPAFGRRNAFMSRAMGGGGGALLMLARNDDDDSLRTVIETHTLGPYDHEHEHEHDDDCDHPTGGTPPVPEPGAALLFALGALALQRSTRRR